MKKKKQTKHKKTQKELMVDKKNMILYYCGNFADHDYFSSTESQSTSQSRFAFPNM